MKFKFKGSKTVKIQCLECQKVSPTFRVYLYDEEDDVDTVPMFNAKDEDIPTGWDIEDEAELDGNLVLGFCPEHCTRELAKVLH